MSDQACAKCGHPRREHSYNGACYGLCGEFIAPPAPTEASKIADALGRWMATTIDTENKHEWHRDMNAAIAVLRSMPQQQGGK